MGNNLMLVFELDAECGVRKQLRNDAGKLQEFFFCHPLPDFSATAPPEAAETSGIGCLPQLRTTAIRCRGLKPTSPCECVRRVARAGRDRHSCVAHGLLRWRHSRAA